MNSEQNYAQGSSQYNFVKNDLQLASSNPHIRWIIVTFHEPAYTSPNSCSSCKAATSIRDIYHPIFDQYRVDLVLEGHVHNYQRSYPLAYNENNPSKPLITAYNKNNYIDPKGSIFAVVGTGGINLHSLAGKEPFIVNQQDSKFGFLNIYFSDDGKAMDAQFIANDGSVLDQFSITKSSIPKVVETPKVLDASVTLLQNSSKDINLNSSGTEGENIKFSLVTDPKKGILNGKVPHLTYKPNKDFVGQDSFTFKATDDKGSESNIATVTIDVKAANQAPVSEDQSVSVDKIKLLDITLVAKDGEGNPIQFALEAQPANGDLSNFDASQGTATYKPNKDFVGQDSFTFKATDDKGSESNIATVTIDVKAANQAPVSEDQSVSVDKNKLLDITLVAKDGEGNPIQFALEAQPANGDLSNFDASQGTATYKPNKDFVGQDSFTFKATDDKGSESNIATVTIDVKAANQAPVSEDQSVSVDKNKLLDITLVAKDGEGNPIQFALEAQPANGDLSNFDASQGTATYKPNKDFVGQDSFTFKATDDKGSESNIATVTIDVKAANQAPVSEDQSVSVDKNKLLDITLVAKDGEGNPIQFALEAQPANGDLSNFDASQGTATYKPNKDFVGQDSFTFKATDDKGSESNIATVTIDVKAANQAPVSEDQSVSVDKNKLLDITLVAKDGEGNPIQFALEAQPANGDLSNFDASQGTATYKPNKDFVGQDSFTFKATDDKGSESNIATVTIDVKAANQAPVSEDQSVSVDKNKLLDITLVAKDGEGNPIQFALEAQPANGDLSNFDSSQGTATYKPNKEYKVNFSTVTIHVKAANQAPVSEDQSVSVDKNKLLDITLVAKDGEGNP